MLDEVVSFDDDFLSTCDPNEISYSVDTDTIEEDDDDLEEKEEIRMLKSNEALQHI